MYSAGSGSATVGAANFHSGAGGGLSGVFSGAPSFTQANSVLIAGGGGGGTCFYFIFVEKKPQSKCFIILLYE